MLQLKRRRRTAVKAQNVLSKVDIIRCDGFVDSKDHAISFYAQNVGSKLADYCDVIQGVGTTDLPKYTRSFWEQNVIDTNWQFYQLAPLSEVGYHRCIDILFWQSGEGELGRIQTAHKGLNALGRRGFGIAVNNNLRATIFNGDRFDCTIAVIIPKNTEDIASICAYLFSDQFKDEVRKIDQALSVTEASN